MDDSTHKKSKNGLPFEQSRRLEESFSTIPLDEKIPIFIPRISPKRQSFIGKQFISQKKSSLLKLEEDILDEPPIVKNNSNIHKNISEYLGFGSDTEPEYNKFICNSKKCFIL